MKSESGDNLPESFTGGGYTRVSPGVMMYVGSLASRGRNPSVMYDPEVLKRIEDDLLSGDEGKVIQEILPLWADLDQSDADTTR